MKQLVIAIALTLATLPVRAESTATKSAETAIQPKTGNWGKFDTCLTDVLKNPGDPAKGRDAYEQCRGCHKADASGRPDAGYPQLAGQHETVLIKQMMDVRCNKRDNPKMHPFIEQSEVPVADVPDIAAYLSTLPVPNTNRKGRGKDLEHGKALYEKDCAECHGKAGEGDAEKFYPMVASQHYPYLVRESTDIHDLVRRNANPEMIKALMTYSDRDIEAVSDYMSRLPPVNTVHPN